MATQDMDFDDLEGVELPQTYQTGDLAYESPANVTAASTAAGEGGATAVADVKEEGKYHLEPVVRNFIAFFYRNVMEQNAFEIQAIYENNFNKITEKFFHNKPWPPAEAIAPLVQNEEIFLILYKELYYRHLYAKLSHLVTLDHRIDSFENYCNLFAYITNTSAPVQLELPNQWLWDIIDEFIYQFQSFSQYRAKLKARTAEEISRLKENNNTWNVYYVLNVLHSLIEKSKIQEQLAVAKTGGDMSSVAGEFGSRTLYKMLGYFSIIGLLRLHCLFGDYYMAMKMLDNVEMNKKGIFNRVTACHITTYYYVGFSYLMMRRYQDAAQTFAQILYFISRTQQYHSRTAQFDDLKKRTDQMYVLLAIAVSLCPQRVDEHVETLLREYHGEKIDRIQQGLAEAKEFSDWFSSACPKFVSPVPPNYENIQNVSQEPHNYQLKLFLREVQHQLLIPRIRSYLKLYKTISVTKLASFLDIDQELLRTALLCYKHKTRALKWTTGSVIEGEYASRTDLTFFIKDDVVHITESKTLRPYGDFFIRHIGKFEDVLTQWKGK